MDSTSDKMFSGSLLTKERIPELDLLRGFAILGVLMVHATSVAATKIPNSIMKNVYVFLNTFSTFCVPAFIFLTGFVLFYNYYERPVTAYSC